MKTSRKRFRSENKNLFLNVVGKHCLRQKKLDLGLYQNSNISRILHEPRAQNYKRYSTGADCFGTRYKSLKCSMRMRHTIMVRERAFRSTANWYQRSSTK